MRAISAVPLLTVASLALSASTLGAQAPRERYDDRDRRQSYRVDLAFGSGFSDGYEEGYDDARRRHRFEPTREGRYRSANRGYDRRYGPKELWQNRYRDGFRRGYENGYNDARRYLRAMGRVWWRF